jgi:hypothetical protein
MVNEIVQIFEMVEDELTTTDDASDPQITEKVAVFFIIK